jgi:hypothetical protein
MSLTVLAQQDAAALRARGTRDYRAGRIAAACKGFGDAARLAPDDAAIQADLALCLTKLGRDEESIAASRRALARGDARVRLGSYYNLALAGAGVTVPRPRTCGVLASAERCGAIRGCRVAWYATGLEELAGDDDRAGELVRAWVTAGAAAAPVNAAMESIEGVHAPELGHVGGGFEASWVEVEGSVDFVIEERFGGRAPSVPATTSCRVVHADPCTRRIGLVCDADGGRRRWAEEVEIAGARAARH